MYGNIQLSTYTITQRLLHTTGKGGLTMKPTELKQEYVKLRAEGRSYSFIAGQLHISKSTCVKWEQELANEISDLKRAGLIELYESYGMSKEARIRNLGGILNRIDTTLEQTDFSEVDPAKLLDFKLKYTEALKGEAVGGRRAINPQTIEARDIVEALADLLNRTRAGDITTDQAQRESLILSNLLRAYDTSEVKAKVDTLEAIIGSRQ